MNPMTDSAARSLGLEERIRELAKPKSILDFLNFLESRPSQLTTRHLTRFRHFYGQVEISASEYGVVLRDSINHFLARNEHRTASFLIPLLSQQEEDQSEYLWQLMDDHGEAIESAVFEAIHDGCKTAQQRQKAIRKGLNHKKCFLAFKYLRMPNHRNDKDLQTVGFDQWLLDPRSDNHNFPGSYAQIENEQKISGFKGAFSAKRYGACSFVLKQIPRSKDGDLLPQYKMVIDSRDFRSRKFRNQVIQRLSSFSQTSGLSQIEAIEVLVEALRDSDSTNASDAARGIGRIKLYLKEKAELLLIKKGLSPVHGGGAKK